MSLLDRKIERTETVTFQMKDLQSKLKVSFTLTVFQINRKLIKWWLFLTKKNVMTIT